jgi:hypothetical protein
MGDLPPGAAASSTEVPKDVKEAIGKVNHETMVIKPAPAPVAKMQEKPTEKVYSKPLKAMTQEEKKKENRTIKVSSVGGAAAKLLPESQDEDKKDETSAKPLLSDNDARCYAARFSDLKGNSGLSHYATVGVPQGRLGTCAKELTNYEA